tara:strand:+ start:597 stop:875 length:279 start_codon:yes stop_codon:yes gene_type:complete
MKAFEQAIEAINKIDNVEEIRDLFDAIRLRQTFLGNKTIRALATGDNVSFNGKNGYTKGTVKKINRKYVLVDTARGSWRVPATMLTKEDSYA